jgi:ribosomal protein L32
MWYAITSATIVKYLACRRYIIFHTICPHEVVTALALGLSTLIELTT